MCDAPNRRYIFFDFCTIGVLLARNLAQWREITGHSDGNNKNLLLRIITLKGHASSLVARPGILAYSND